MRLWAIAALLAASAVAAEPAAWHLQPADDTELWMVGSIHYLREQDHPLPPLLDRLYAGVDELVMEIDLDDLDPVDVQARFMQAAMLAPAMPLSSLLDPRSYATVSAMAAELGLPIAALEPFEPWFVALTLMDLGMAKIGFRADQGIEQYLLQRAARDSKRVLGLETVQDQLDVFDGLPMPEQRALLAQTLADIGAASVEMELLVAAWRDGRLDAVAEKLNESFDGVPSLYRSLVVERNRRWIGTIERLASTPGRYLIVVGALHLIGENSVIDLLRARGHAVERVSN